MQAAFDTFKYLNPEYHVRLYSKRNVAVNAIHKKLGVFKDAN